MNKYVRLCRAFNDKGILVPQGNVWDYIKDDNEWYVSTYFYNEDQYKAFQQTGSVKGVRDVLTDRIWWDFDDKDNPDKARQDAHTTVLRLIEKGIDKNALQVYYSGNKGCNVVMDVDTHLTPEQVEAFTENVAGDLKTFDTTMYDATQILRVPGTKHQVSGFYKIPLSIGELSNSIEMIRTKAKSLDNVKENFDWTVANVPAELLVSKKKEEKKSAAPEEIDWSQRPKEWKQYKWALLQGQFNSGERHHALMIIAATCRGLGYDKETTYYMCKSALKKQAALHGQEEFNKEELWNNIIEESVFADGWEGGQYSPKTDPWLRKYCERMNIKWEEDKEDNPCVTLGDMTSHFESFAKNFEQNIIKTGILELDNNLTLSTSTLNGLLGQPGSGKTSVSMNILRNTSKMNIPSIFFSLDMGMPLVYSKLVQKETGFSFKRALELYRNGDSHKLTEIGNKIKEDYKNVSFNFRSGLTVADIKTIKRSQEQQTGKKIKFCVIDYLECLASPYADATAGAAFIANQLKDLANEEEMCILLLLQTQKHSTSDISDPLLSMKQIKGSSVLEQACSTVLTLWREGYSPRTVDDDKSLSFAIVKNRFGGLWSGDFAWNGVTGDVRSMTEEEKIRFNDFKQRKAEMRAKQNEQKDSEWK